MNLSKEHCAQLPNICTRCIYFKFITAYGRVASNLQTTKIQSVHAGKPFSPHMLFAQFVLQNPSQRTPVATRRIQDNRVWRTTISISKTDECVYGCDDSAGRLHSIMPCDGLMVAGALGFAGPNGRDKGRLRHLRTPCHWLRRRAMRSLYKFKGITLYSRNTLSRKLPSADPDLSPGHCRPRSYRRRLRGR